jgi:hypothetical protein
MDNHQDTAQPNQPTSEQSDASGQPGTSRQPGTSGQPGTSRQPGTSGQPVAITHSIKRRFRHTQRLLSPWVQRWLHADSETTTLESETTAQPAFRLQKQRPVAMTETNTRFLVNRIQRTSERSTAWEPDMGSLKPGMTDRLTDTVVTRSHFQTIGVKRQSQPREQTGLYHQAELPLASQTSQAVSEDYEQEVEQKGSLLDVIREKSSDASAVPEILSRLPRSSGQLILPTSPSKKKTKREQPVIPPKSRLFTRVQEVTTEETPSTGVEPPMPPPAQPKPTQIEIDAEEDQVDDTALETTSGPGPPEESSPVEPEQSTELPPVQENTEQDMSSDMPSESKPVPPDETLLLLAKMREPVETDKSSLPAEKPETAPPLVKPGQPAEPPPVQQIDKPDMPLRQPPKEMPAPISPTEEAGTAHPIMKPDQPAEPPPVQQIGEPDMPVPPPEEAKPALPVVKPDQPTGPPPLQQVSEPDMPLRQPPETPASVLSTEETETPRPVVKPDQPTTSEAVPVTPKVDEPPALPAGTFEQKHTPETPPQPEKPVSTLDQDVLSRTGSKQQLPLSMPLVQPRRQASSRKKMGETPPPITPQIARAQLATQGWRFKTRPGESSTASEHVGRAAANLEQPSSPGKPLPDEPRAQMEGMLGRDFGDVRIHRTDLGPLNVQAATKGQDVYFDRGQDDFEKPESMALLGHELTHVTQQSSLAQTKPVVQMSPLPVARIPAKVGAPAGVGAEEAEAERTEQTVLTYSRTGQTTAMPLATGPGIQRVADSGPEKNMGSTDAFGGSQSNTDAFQADWLEMEMEQDEERQALAEENFAALQDTLEELIDERLTEMMETLGLEEELEEPSGPNLDNLARQILPYVKRLISVERERRAFT